MYEADFGVYLFCTSILKLNTKQPIKQRMNGQTSERAIKTDQTAISSTLNYQAIRYIILLGRLACIQYILFCTYFTLASWLQFQRCHLIVIFIMSSTLPTTTMSSPLIKKRSYDRYNARKCTLCVFNNSDWNHFSSSLSLILCVCCVYTNMTVCLCLYIDGMLLLVPGTWPKRK